MKAYECGQVKHDATYNEAMDRAELDYRSNALRCPYLFSSNFADAYWITAWALYNGTRKPSALRKSRGHTWKLSRYGFIDAVVTVDAPDHRNGVREVQS